jgi:hypothetical protein
MSDEQAVNHDQQQAIAMFGQGTNAIANFLSTVGFTALANRIRPVKIEIKSAKPEQDPSLVPIPEASGEQAGTELGLARQWLEAGVPIAEVKDRIKDMNMAQRAKDPKLAAALLAQKAQCDIAFAKFGKEENLEAGKKMRLVK